MKYKIIVDKQSRKNPSSEKKEYIIDIEELRTKGDIYDSLIITKNEDYVIRRLSLSELQVLSVLEEPIKEALPNLNIELFEGDNYIYLSDMTGNKFYAEYIVKNEFTDMYVTNAEMNSAINQSASQIELNVNQKLTTYSTLEELENAKDEAIETSKENVDNKLKNYSTTVEMNSAINMKAESITSEVSKTYSTKTETSTAKTEAIKSANSNTDDKLKNYTETTKLGTAIEQNYEHVKLAWNQISEFIQMMIINNNASFAILDSNKKVMMALDKTGQHFYKSDGTTIFGEMGVNKEDSNSYISFAVDGEYGQNISDGMAWGIKTKSDNEFHPIMYLKNYNIVKNGSSYGQLELSNCDIVLTGNIDAGSGGAIQCGSIIIGGSATNGVKFLDTDGNNFLELSKGDGSVITPYDAIKIFDSIKFYKNASGGNTFKIGESIFTDDGFIFGNKLYISELVANNEKINVVGDFSANSFNINGYGPTMFAMSEGHQYRCDWQGDSRLHFYVDVTDVGNISDKRLKTGIKKVDEDLIKAIGELDYKQFKKDNRNGLVSVGIIAQDLIKILNKYGKNAKDYELLEEFQYRLDDEKLYYKVDYEQFLLLRMMANERKIREQQEQIEQQNTLIKSLIERIEKLEAK